MAKVLEVSASASVLPVNTQEAVHTHVYIYYFSHKWPKYWSTMEGQKVSGLALLTRLELESWGLCSKLWNFSNFPDVSWIQIYRSGACNLLNSGQRWALTKNWPAFFVAMRLSPHWVSLHLPGNHILNTHVTVWPAQKEHWLLYAVESSSSLHPQWVSFWASPHGTWYPVMPFSPPKSPPLPLDVPTFPFCFHTSGQVPPLPSQSWIYHTLPSEAHQRHSLCKSLLYFMTFPFYSSTTSIPQLIASAQTPSLVGVLHP